jgi:hypothetical protein
MPFARLSRIAVLGALASVLAACSTGVEEADRAIFAEACSGVTGATQSACACAFDELQGSGGSDQVIGDTLDDLRQGRAPQRLTRAVASCTTQN